MKTRREMLRWIGVLLGGAVGLSKGSVIGSLFDLADWSPPRASAQTSGTLTTSPLLAVNAIRAVPPDPGSTDGGLIVTYAINRGLYEARRSEIGFAVETLLTVASTDGGLVWAVSPKIDPIALVKVGFLGDDRGVFDTTLVWRARGTPIPAAGTVRIEYIGRLAYMPSGTQVTFPNGTTEGFVTISLG